MNNEFFNDGIDFENEDWNNEENMKKENAEKESDFTDSRAYLEYIYGVYPAMYFKNVPGMARWLENYGKDYNRFYSPVYTQIQLNTKCDDYDTFVMHTDELVSNLSDEFAITKSECDELTDEIIKKCDRVIAACNLKESDYFDNKEYFTFIKTKVQKSFNTNYKKVSVAVTIQFSRNPSQYKKPCAQYQFTWDILKTENDTTKYIAFLNNKITDIPSEWEYVARKEQKSVLSEEEQKTLSQIENMFDFCGSFGALQYLVYLWSKAKVILPDGEKLETRLIEELYPGKIKSIIHQKTNKAFAALPDKQGSQIKNQKKQKNLFGVFKNNGFHKLTKRERQKIQDEKWCNFLNGARTVLRIIVIVVAILLIMHYKFNTDVVIVSGNSMTPTIKDTDMLFVKKDDTLSINVGDVVFAKVDGKRVVKRVVAEPGDDLSVKITKTKTGKTAYFDGILVEEEKETRTLVINGIETDMIIKNLDYDGGYTLKKDEYFLVGDNYEESYDSRDYGAVTAENITTLENCIGILSGKIE